MDLKRLGPLICQHIIRHHRAVTQKHINIDDLEKRIDAIVSDSTLVFSKLSLREKQVCRALLLGQDEKSIAIEQDVSASTIATYRKRLQAKLGIASKEELFQLALLSV
jgi:DNA-binding CsgD family transcriptional regulator